MAEQDPQYKVGYGKAPQKARFQKGVSGNPKGRPTGSKNFASMLLKECRKKIQIKLPGGGLRTVTKVEAAVMQLTNKSAQGDPRSLRLLIDLVQIFEEREASGSSPKNMAKNQLSVVDLFLSRLKNYQDVTEPCDDDHRDPKESK